MHRGQCFKELCPLKRQRAVKGFMKQPGRSGGDGPQTEFLAEFVLKPVHKARGGVVGVEVVQAQLQEIVNAIERRFTLDDQLDELGEISARQHAGIAAAELKTGLGEVDLLERMEITLGVVKKDDLTGDEEIQAAGKDRLGPESPFGHGLEQT